VADLPALIRSEREALVAYLETLDAEQWVTPSLCGGWTVQDVAAHLAVTPTFTPVAASIDVARAGFRPNRFIADTAVRFARRGPDAILAQLRSNAATGARAIGIAPPATLLDSVVHALDIRRPLGGARRIPADTMRPALSIAAGTTFPLSLVMGGSIQRRYAGLRLVAEDADWSRGEGVEVRAPGEVLLLALTGRPIRVDELSGPGAAELHGRL
jgi:uncharacterized protein (TIGR03083 family)